jgi:hypothetical protein
MTKPRYVTKPRRTRNEFDDDDFINPAVLINGAPTVYDEEVDPWQPTGILDPDGDELFRYDPPEPIGFIWAQEDDDWE